MSGIDHALFDIGYLDTLSCGRSPVHRLDPRAKILVTAVALLAIASSPKYAVATLFPYFLFPLVLLVQGELPWRYLARKLILVLPFALMLGMANPFLDQAPYFLPWGGSIASGWLSFASILLRSLLTVSVALLLIATTSFPGVCMGMERLGMPSALAVQLLLLYRYLFVLIDEGYRLSRARALRSCGRRGTGIRVFGSMVGQMLVRTLERAQRVHLAMLCRGFDGEIRMLRRFAFGGREILFCAGWIAYFAFCRLADPVQLIGRLVLEVLG